MENEHYLTVEKTECLVERGVTLPKNPWIKVKKRSWLFHEKEWFYMKKSELDNLKSKINIKDVIHYTEYPVFSSVDLLEKVLVFQEKFIGCNLMLLNEPGKGFQCAFEDPRIKSEENNIIVIKDDSFINLLYKLVLELTKYNIS